jgi:hypothetical protein
MDLRRSSHIIWGLQRQLCLTPSRGMSMADPLEPAGIGAEIIKLRSFVLRRELGAREPVAGNSPVQSVM